MLKTIIQLSQHVLIQKIFINQIYFKISISLKALFNMCCCFYVYMLDISLFCYFNAYKFVRILKTKNHISGQKY